MEQKKVKQIIEALLFASNRPLTVTQIKEVLEETEAAAIKGVIKELNDEYKSSERSFNIGELAGGYQISTNPEYAPWLKKMYSKARADKLSKPSLETLAIIAYRQPITRVEIEDIRGVSIDGVIKTLTERSLVRISGRKQIPGRPFLYNTTKEFLEFFALQSLQELPSLEEFGELAVREGGGEDDKIEQPTQEDRSDRQ